MRKFHVKDEDGEVFEVEELDTEPTIDETEPMPTNDDLTLTNEEISALKGLAAVAPKLMALIETKDGCGTEDEEEIEETEEMTDGEEKIEEVIDTDEETTPRDSKSIARSVGAIEKKKKKTSDSIDNSLEVEAAWAKRYGGN